MPPDDRTRLQHVLDAATEARTFVQGRSFADLEADRMLLLALVRDIEVMGEAASRVSRETRERHPAVPWQEMVGMRNHLIHGYFDVDARVVWQTVVDDIPVIEEAVTQILSSLDVPPEP